jgi:radical SAM superfamily enzyme YgiQ (UPF0313 family)
MNVLFLNLLDPQGMYVNRDYCGGFGSAFPKRKGRRHDVFPPIFDAYAASILEKEGYSVSIIDAQATGTSDAQLLEMVEKSNPEVVVSRISLPSFGSDLKTCDMVKTRFPNVFYVGWGSICKVEPEAVLSKSRLDAVISDELEFAILNLVNAIRSKGELGEVGGISFKANANVVHNPSVSGEKSLDALPLPAYHLLDLKNYKASESYFFPEGSRSRFVDFFTLLSSRGCDFNCFYCPYPTSFGTWRAMTPRKVVDEIEFLVKNYGIKVFWFHDQVFTMIPERVEQICSEIIDRGLDVTWACETHLRKLSTSLVVKMKEAGCTRIQVGIETGDPKLLASVGKVGCTVDEVENAMRQLHELGILVEANFIVGLPGENWSTVRNTAKMIRKTRPDDVAISMITPYPGTPLFALAKKRNWIVTDDWNRYSTSQPVMASPDFSVEDMRGAQRYLYGTFLYGRRLGELDRALRKHMFRRFFQELATSLPEMGFGAYAITRYGIKSRLARVPRKLEN